MALDTTLNSTSAKQNDKPLPRPVNSMPVVDQISLDELTPLQRQRLDAAVMLLVNYLVSASPSSDT